MQEKEFFIYYQKRLIFQCSMPRMYLFLFRKSIDIHNKSITFEHF